MDRRSILRIVSINLFAVAAACLPMAVHADTITRTLHLDDGFIGHPVSMNLFGGEFRLSWGTGALASPGDLTISMASGTVSILSASAGMFVKPVSASFPQATSSDAIWTQSSVQELVASGTWQSVTSTSAKGWTSGAVLVSPQATVQVASVQQGMGAGSASWYSYKHCNCAASPDFPKGTKLLVSRTDDATKSVVVTVNDFGPDRRLFPDRVIDLDKVAFAAIGNTRAGLLQVTVKPLSPKDPLVATKAVAPTKPKTSNTSS
ncbi:MAG: RlpA-like double-psi beta-barrel domain-containing protein [Patescibacteria group bacterium]